MSQMDLQEHGNCVRIPKKNPRNHSTSSNLFFPDKRSGRCLGLARSLRDGEVTWSARVSFQGCLLPQDKHIKHTAPVTTDKIESISNHGLTWFKLFWQSIHRNSFVVATDWSNLGGISLHRQRRSLPPTKPRPSQEGGRHCPSFWASPPPISHSCKLRTPAFLPSCVPRKISARSTNFTMFNAACGTCFPQLLQLQQRAAEPGSVRDVGKRALIPTSFL